MCPENCLFPENIPGIDEMLEALGPALDKVAPLKAKHRSRLPGDIAELSRALTSERGGVPNYLRDPALQNAYLRYFLPWNILRLGNLLAGLRLDLPDNARILDLGAGPQTFALALLAGRPDLRHKPLKIVAVDRSRPMLKIGADMLKALAPETNWRIVTVAAGLDETLKSEEGDFQLIVAANVLNEWATARDEPLEARLGRFLGCLTRKLAASGSLILAEPGTRLGGRILSAARAKARLHPLAPCAHEAACPLPGRRDTGWCHFTFSPKAAPGWLINLSKEAGLAKERLSLSFLHLGRRRPEYPEHTARVVSESFPLAGTRCLGQYACAEPGLLLLRHETTKPLKPGELTAYALVQPEARDSKSQALIVTPGRPSKEVHGNR